MQKAKHILTFLLAFALIATVISPAQAAGPTGGWRSGIACQNLEGSQAAVTLTFYREGSSSEAIHYDSTIPENGSKNWLTTSVRSMPSFPTNFIGAAVISSSTQLACNLNTESTNVGTPSSPYRMGTASGFNDAQTSATMYVSQVVKGVVGYQTYVAVQNTSTSDVNVTVSYYNGNGSEVTGARETSLVKGQSTKVFYTNENAGLPTGFNGGAKITSADGSTKLAVLVAWYKNGASYGTSQFQSYNGVSSGSRILYVPRFVRNMLGNQSGLTIQNVGTVATVIHVDFSFPGIATPIRVSSPTAIQPNASWLLYAPSRSLSQLVPVDSLPEGNRQGSAVVTAQDANGRLAANVNEDNSVSGNSRFGQGATYNAINDDLKTSTVFFPQFTKAFQNTFWSGLQISNTTGTPGTCDIEYVAQPGINENDVPLQAFGSITRWSKTSVPSQVAMRAMAPGYNAAVKVTCTVPVTGIVNMSAYGTKYGDSFEMTGGLNQ